MRYTVTSQLVQFIGFIWQGGVGPCAQAKKLTAQDLESIGDVRNREAVADWIYSHSGDFQNIEDFRADFHIGNEHIVHEWKEEDSEAAYNACMYSEDY